MRICFQFEIQWIVFAIVINRIDILNGENWEFGKQYIQECRDISWIVQNQYYFIRISRYSRYEKDEAYASIHKPSWWTGKMYLPFDSSSVRYLEREKLHPQTTGVEGWRMCPNIMGLFIRWRFFFQAFYFLKGKAWIFCIFPALSIIKCYDKLMVPRIFYHNKGQGFIRLSLSKKGWFPQLTNVYYK